MIAERVACGAPCGEHLSGCFRSLLCLHGVDEAVHRRHVLAVQGVEDGLHDGEPRRGLRRIPGCRQIVEGERDLRTGLLRMRVLEREEGEKEHVEAITHARSLGA